MISIYNKSSFSYQNYIIYAVQYGRPIFEHIPDISPNIRYSICKTPIRYVPDIRYLEHCIQGLSPSE